VEELESGSFLLYDANAEKKLKKDWTLFIKYEIIMAWDI
jgi:hypothetical protein